MAKPFFINAPRKKRRKVARRRKKLYGAAAKAKRGILMGAAAKAKRKTRKATARKSARRKTRRRTGTVKSIRKQGSKRPVSRATWLASGFRRNVMARRKTRRRTASRRIRRRNPPRLFGRGTLNQAFNVVIGGTGVTAGKIVARQGAKLLPNVDTSSPVGIALQLGIALAAGIAAKQFLRLKGPFVDGMVYGAASGAAESLIKMVAPDAVDALLGDYTYPFPLGAYPSRSLPALPAGSLEERAAMGSYGTGMWGGGM